MNYNNSNLFSLGIDNNSNDLHVDSLYSSSPTPSQQKQRKSKYRNDF